MEEKKSMKEKRGIRGILVNVLLAASVIGLIIAVVGLVSIQGRYREAQDEYENLREQFTVAEEAGASSRQEEKQSAPRYDLQALREANPDCVAWLEIPGTPISYPVLQGTDNATYLYRTFEGKDNPSGALFLDCRTEPDFTSPNNIIYGHNMKDGSMFAWLGNYMDEDTLNENAEIHLYTDAGMETWEVFTASRTDVDDQGYRVDFYDEAEQEEFLWNIGGEPYALTVEDRILSLSTCVDDNTQSLERFLIHAVYRGTDKI